MKSLFRALGMALKIVGILMLIAGALGMALGLIFGMLAAL